MSGIVQVDVTKVLGYEADREIDLGPNTVPLAIFDSCQHPGGWQLQYVNTYTGRSVYLRLSENPNYVEVGVDENTVSAVTFADPWGGGTITGRP